MPQKMENNYRHLLIKELAELWLIDIKNVLKPSSYAIYQSYTSKYILPYIGDEKSDAFGRKDLSAMLGDLQAGQGQEAPLSQHTVYIVESMVRAMFHYGTGNHLVPEVSFGKAEYKIKNKKDAMPLSELETRQLVQMAEQQGTDMQVQAMLPLYTGVNLSELCGLKWEDIDFNTGKIHIHRNLMRIQQKAPENSTKKTSTVLKEFELPENECREFIMPEKLKNFLEMIADKRKPAKERYVAGLDKKMEAEDIKKGQPDGRTLQARLKVLGEKAWIPELTFKRLRDTFAVMCLQAGGDVYSLAYVLGVGTEAVCGRYGQWLVKKDGFLRGIG